MWFVLCSLNSIHLSAKQRSSPVSLHSLCNIYSFDLHTIDVAADRPNYLHHQTFPPVSRCCVYSFESFVYFRHQYGLWSCDMPAGPQLDKL